MRFTEYENISAPWRPYYGDIPATLDYPEGSIYDAVRAAADRSPESVAISYMNKDWSYASLMDGIDAAARALIKMGVRVGERVLVCLPNTPQAVFCLYALSRIGAVGSFIHPLSAEGEIEYSLNEIGARRAIALDQSIPKFEAVWKNTSLERVIRVTPVDELNPIMRAAYPLTAGRGIPKPTDSRVTGWREFIKAGGNVPLPNPIGGANDDAVVLFSGGTTGTTKGVRLTNLNLNALAAQTVAMCGRDVHGKSMLAAMPMFHGFGLGVCIHTILFIGARSILVPRVILKEYAALIRRKRPNYIAGVPTLYEAMSRNPFLDGADLSCLEGVFSGGDSLPPELKKRLDRYLADHGASVRVREGYGLTECVTASCLTPITEEREGSIGIPFPDTYYKICDPKTCEELAAGEEGEICLTGPTVMPGYLGRDDETAAALRRHSDGHTWLHTGDLGSIDKDGFLYFKQRIKRVIITSGYNVYPSQIESALEKHPAVRLSCVIGVPDPYRMRRIKAFVTLNEGYSPSEKLGGEILDSCRKYVARYAMPREIEFRDELPTTLVGKVAYTVLEKEEADKNGEV